MTRSRQSCFLCFHILFLFRFLIFNTHNHRTHIDWIIYMKALNKLLLVYPLFCDLKSDHNLITLCLWICQPSHCLCLSPSNLSFSQVVICLVMIHSLVEGDGTTVGSVGVGQAVHSLEALVVSLPSVLASLPLTQVQNRVMWIKNNNTFQCPHALKSLMHY